MRHSATIFIVLICVCIVNASLLEPVIENVVHIKASASGPNGAPGTWKKKTVWKPRWVKEWKSAKVMKPTYKKVWSPVLIQEWIPFPKPPSDWDTKAPSSKPAEPSGAMPLWDPMPYPESQQPPPAGSPLSPFPLGAGGPGAQGGHDGHGSHGGHGGHGGLGLGGPDGPGISGPGGPGRPSVQNGPGGPFFKGKPHCHHPGCSDSSSSTFTMEQISKIIGHSRYKKETDHFNENQHPEPASDTTAQQDSENWRSRRQSSLAFNLLQGLSQFLVPPKIPGFNYQSKQAEYAQPPKKPSAHHQPAHLPNHVHKNGFHQAQQAPSQTKFKPAPPAHHYHKPTEQPHHFTKSKLQMKNPATSQNNGAPNKQTNYHYHHVNENKKPSNNPNLIQPADLVSEYHYSEFDITQPITPSTTQSTEELKFKPLPQSMWSLPKVINSKLQNNPQLHGPGTQGKPRPIRKDPEQVGNVQKNFHHSVTPSPSPPITVATTSIFEQERVVTKEIIPTDFDPKWFPTNHRFEPDSKYKITEKKNSTSMVNNGLETTSSEPQKTGSHSLTKQPVRLSEEALLKALQKNPTSHQTTTPWYLPKTSSSSENSDMTDVTTTTTAKSPVYIVTPIYQSPAN